MKAVKSICHITSVHARYDNRIFLKQCRSVAEAGHDVALIVADGRGDEIKDGVNIYDVGSSNGRVNRMLLGTRRLYQKARELKADIYHFHDPELIPWARCLLKQKKIVIYDVHEDYYTSICQKAYLPRPVRFLTANFAAFLEYYSAKPFYKIAAEKYYRKRFPEACAVLNYPQSSLFNLQTVFNPNSNRILYTGVISRDRGALMMAGLVRARQGIEVFAVGRCSFSLKTEMQRHAGKAVERLHIPGKGRHMSFHEITEYYAQGDWLAGIALFPESDHYRQKELTKFFEYMAVGLPIIASNFPAWVDLIEKQGFGLCVDPGNFKELGNAINWLRDHPDQAMAMGQRGREAVRKKYNWEIEAKKLLAFYDQLA
jgi:glycosyltransferase involved in cell wall biosynthesis